MGYVEKIIQPGEKVLVIGRMHWIIFLRSAAILLAGFATMLLGSGALFLIIGLCIFAFGTLVLVQSLVEAWTTEIVVTDKRVIRKTGLIRRATTEMNMDKVESVIVDQSLTGRIFGYGSIVVRGTGAGIEGLHHIMDPLALRSAIVVR